MYFLKIMALSLRQTLSPAQDAFNIAVEDQRPAVIEPRLRLGAS